jgi:hypothetical protein
MLCTGTEFRKATPVQVGEGFTLGQVFRMAVGGIADGYNVGNNNCHHMAMKV